MGGNLGSCVRVRQKLVLVSAYHRAVQCGSRLTWSQQNRQQITESIIIFSASFPLFSLDGLWSGIITRA